MTNRELSQAECFKKIFGSERRIDVWGEVIRFSVEPPEEFTAQQVKQTIEEKYSIAPQTTNKELGLLEELSMIVRLPSPTYDRRVHYTRTASALWLIPEAALKAAEVSLSAPTSTK